MTAALATTARNKNDPWPEEKIAAMLKLAKDGNSSSQIARALGDGTTRNAVIGKLLRLERAGVTVERRGLLIKQGSAPARGVNARARPSLPTLALGDIPAVKRGRPFNPRGTATLPAVGLGDVPARKRGRSFNHQTEVTRPPLPPKLVEPIPFANGARITIMELSSKTCKWPIGDPQAKDFCFCGHGPREGSSYCPYHAKVAKQPPSDRLKAQQLPPIPVANFSGLSK